MSADIRNRPAKRQVIPANVPGIPHCFDAEMIGRIANDTQERWGTTLPLWLNGKMKVPIPAVKRGSGGSSNEQRNEDKRQKPRKRNCMPTTVRLNGDKLVVFIVTKFN